MSWDCAWNVWICLFFLFVEKKSRSVSFARCLLCCPGDWQIEMYYWEWGEKEKKTNATCQRVTGDKENSDIQALVVFVTVPSYLKWSYITDSFCPNTVISIWNMHLGTISQCSGMFLISFSELYLPFAFVILREQTSCSECTVANLWPTLNKRLNVVHSWWKKERRHANRRPFKHTAHTPILGNCHVEWWHDARGRSWGVDICLRHIQWRNER